MPADVMSPVILGAVIGAGASILGGWLAGWRQSELERTKWERSRVDIVHTETRAALAALAKDLAAIAHSIMWATYKAPLTPEFTEDDLAKYESEYHNKVSDLVGAQMLVAALDHKLFSRVTPLVSEAIELGGDAYVGLRAVVENPIMGADAALAETNAKALALIKKIPGELANTLQTGA